jgi:hypothetical protein
MKITMSNDKQQTAVEWLREQFHKVPQSEFGNLFEQAKKTEKEQIKDAYNDGHTDGHTAKPGLTSGTMYYNETYGGNK